MNVYKVLFLLVAPLSLSAQSSHSKTLSDGNRKFSYTDSAGVTASYISYFGDTFAAPGLTTIDGEVLDTVKRRSRIIVYNFWFITCPPCVAEIPTLNKLRDAHPSDSVLFIAITFDKGPRLKDFLQKTPFRFKIVSLPMADIERIKKISFYPFTVVTDGNQKISFALFGKTDMAKQGNNLFDILENQLKK